MADSKTSNKTKIFRFNPFEEVIGKLFADHTSDVEFRVVNEDGKSKPIRAHKTYLSAISPVFASMFGGNWIEANYVKIEDADFDVFKSLLRCLYGKELEINLDNVEPLLYLAKKYDIGRIVASCSNFMLQQLSIEHVLSYSNAANTYDLEAVQSSCWKFISENTQDVLELPEFLSCSKSMLASILQLKKVSCTEANMFDSCMKWAEQRCVENELDKTAENIRNELGDCFSLIRFKEMDNAEFIARFKLYSNGLFASGELCELMEFFQLAKLITDKRCQLRAKPENDDIVYSFGNKGMKEIKDFAECTVRFSTSKPLILTKFHFSNILVETTDDMVSCPSILGLQLKKDNVKLFSRSCDTQQLKSNTLFHDMGNTYLIEKGTYELSITFRPKTKSGRKFVLEYNVEGQTQNNIELVVQNNDIGTDNQVKLIACLCFTKFGKNNLHLLGVHDQRMKVTPLDKSTYKKNIEK